jgi:crossover junction endodeoxyribonuclease RuvC
MATLCLGIDPGMNGAAALISGRKLLSVFRFKDKTGLEIKNHFRHLKEVYKVDSVNRIEAALEKVHSMPKQGVASSFKFGVSYGHVQGLLDGMEIPYQFVTPQKWMKDLGCMTRGDKNVTKAMAHRTWPNYAATHADSDALLIALWLSRFGLS